jgi:hypothetical protein
MEKSPGETILKQAGNKTAGAGGQTQGHRSGKNNGQK